MCAGFNGVFELDFLRKDEHNGHEQKFSSLSQIRPSIQRDIGMPYEGGDADV